MFKKCLISGLILFSLVGLPAATHKFYVSITQIDINARSHKMEISARIFSDDLEASVLAESGQKLRLGSGREHPKADSLLFDYLVACLNLNQDGKGLELNFIGQEVEADVTWIYLETSTGISLTKPVTIRNVILHERFPDQKNIVNLRFGKETDSRVHTRGHPEYSYLTEGIKE